MKLWSVLGMLLIPAFGAWAQGPGREATPAVVNPALRSKLRWTMSLDGEWDFAVDPKKRGEKEHWYRPEVPLPNKMRIRVPGSWEAQGMGGKGFSVAVTPERVKRPMRGSYVGTAWYRKEVTVPRAWRGREIWLKFGGVHAQGWFWANGTFLGHDKSYCRTWKYRVTDLVDAKGNLVIAAKVRNDVPSGKGLFGWVHRFGGLYRGVELEATPSVLVDNAYAQGDIDAKSASVHVTLRSTAAAAEQVDVQVAASLLPPLHLGEGRGEGTSGRQGRGRPAGKASTTVTIPAGKAVEVVLTTPLDPFRPWSPAHPNLYRADIVLKRDGKAVDGWAERFGVRKWEVRGANFYLNNRKHIVRGFGDDYVYPLTIVSPADKSIHVRHLSLAKQCGFNYVRHHTHCEIPEFFEAADEVGIMVQPELPYYGSRPSAGDASWFRPKEDLRELVTHYRRYVSLSTYCTGNEGHLGSPIDKEIYALAKKLDPSRLFLHQDGGANYSHSGSLGTQQFWRESNVTVASSDFGTGSRYISPPGGAAAWPWFAHEYLCVEIDSDPRLAPKYTGAQLPPVPADIYDPELAAAGLDVGWRDAILDSGLYQQRLWQKFGIESSRLDPDCDGYHYWVIADIGLYGELGLFDPFWDVKKTTPEYFYQFNSPTTILAAYGQRPIGAAQRIVAEGDELKVDWWISHFGEAPLEKDALVWRVEAGKRVLGRGRIEKIDAAIGDVKKVGATAWTVGGIREPVHARLVAGIEDTKVKNSWDIWLFPRPRKGSGKGLAASERVHKVLAPRYPGIARVGTPEAAKAEVVILDRTDRAFFDALGKGKSVVMVGLRGPRPGLNQEWPNARQKGTAVADHPALGDFPHQGYLNYLFFRLVKNTVQCSDEAYRGVEKLMVNRGKWPQGYLAHVVQAKAGKGKLLASGLNLLSDNVEAVHLLDQFIRYARSDRFQPKGTFGTEAAGKVWQRMRDLNGWSETVVTHHHRRYASFLGELPVDIARFARGQVEVAWRTQPVPEALKPDGTFTFTWVAALGWVSQPPSEFQLMLGDTKLLTFGLAQQKTTWKGADGKVALTFLPMGRMAGNEGRSGIMALTVPAAMLTRGEKALLRVRAPQTGSKRWFGLYHCP